MKVFKNEIKTVVSLWPDVLNVCIRNKNGTAHHFRNNEKIDLDAWLAPKELVKEKLTGIDYSQIKDGSIVCVESDFSSKTYGEFKDCGFFVNVSNGAVSIDIVKDSIKTITVYE